MPKLRQLAIAAKEPARLANFYREVFDLKAIPESEAAIFLSDGAFNLPFLRIGPNQRRGLYHLGFEIEDMRRIRERLGGLGVSLVPSPDGMPYAEFRIEDPDGNPIDLSGQGFGVSKEKSPAPIRHVALYTPNPQRLADFYGSVFGMRELNRSDRSSIFVSDGYFNLALLFQRSEEKLGLHHFGFHVKSNEEMQRRVEKAGVSRGARRPDRIPYAEYRVHDPEGNGIDISEKGWEV
jgi:catechol 2,3-dioxygenase-like lactoylglutathione lyase family enzyme